MIYLQSVDVHEFSRLLYLNTSSINVDGCCCWLGEPDRSSVSEIPIGRMVEPEEIANLVLFLVSEKASAITGQTIAVEGGAGRGLTTEGGKRMVPSPTTVHYFSRHRTPSG